ncbi:hypothetical protein DCS_01364 [Drechmeria coniospora]|uniref:Major facilitator superfamily (MFS) profile domain-containing protein n=1 Tax=Drechmeria coniospora TaxID=98403 RepID=A0A151GSZ9_DRECN|nr:hypothetical protein DCS_01364 [Drechmeria coniospora]KYK60227.1 hypothetical protein DCS_01364 [Drechmeria coniospora]
MCHPITAAIPYRSHHGSPFKAVEKLEAAHVKVDTMTNDAGHQLDLEAVDGHRRGSLITRFLKPAHFALLLIFFATIGGFTTGLDQYLVFGTSPPHLSQNLDLALTQSRQASLSALVGAVAGALLLHSANEYFGRKGAALLSTLLCSTGAALHFVSFNFAMVLAARVILSLGIGLASGTIPIYVAETAERGVRGNLISLYQCTTILGNVVGSVVGPVLVEEPSNKWRCLLATSLAVSITMFLGALLLPESPRFLLHKGRMIEALGAWRRMRCLDSYEQKAELILLVAAARQVETWVGEGRQYRVPRARRAFVCANIVVVMGQLTGVNAVMNYLPILMNRFGVGEHDMNLTSLVGTGALLLGSIPTIFLMDRCSRRFWAMATLPGVFVGLLLIAISHQFDAASDVELVAAFYLTGLVLFMSFLGAYTSVAWVILSEVYPTHLRSVGMATSNTLLFLTSFLLTNQFDAMQEVMSETGLILGFYGGIALIGGLYQVLFLPETKDRTLEEMDDVFSRSATDIVRENWTALRKTVTSPGQGPISNAVAEQTKKNEKRPDLSGGEKAAAVLRDCEAALNDNDQIDVKPWCIGKWDIGNRNVDDR